MAHQISSRLFCLERYTELRNLIYEVALIGRVRTTTVIAWARRGNLMPACTLRNWQVICREGCEFGTYIQIAEVELVASLRGNCIVEFLTLFLVQGLTVLSVRG